MSDTTVSEEWDYISKFRFDDNKILVLWLHISMSNLSRMNVTTTFNGFFLNPEFHVTRSDVHSSLSIKLYATFISVMVDICT